MIESIEIDSFRCYKKLKLEKLKRVTVITGDNGSGKTALLEAFLIGSRANMDAINLASQSRGLFGSIAGGAFIPLQFWRPLWESFFYQESKKGRLIKSRLCTINLQDSERMKYGLTLSYSESAASLAFSPTTIGVPISDLQPIIFDRQRGDEHEQQMVFIGANGAIQAPPMMPLGPITYFFASTAQYNEVDNVTWYSRMKESGSDATDNLNELICDKFEFIKEIIPLAPDNVQALHAVLKEGGTRRISLISAGLQKLVTLLLAISDRKKSVVLIDEIENGIFYGKYAFLWETILDYAKRTDSQIILTTHSLECLRAAVPTIKENLKDFCQLRTRREKGNFIVERLEGRAMVAGLSSKVEMR